MNARPFKVINCLAQGFAVAGPVAEREIGGQTPDLEMVQWGMAADKAFQMADALNANPKLKRRHD